MQPASLLRATPVSALVFGSPFPAPAEGPGQALQAAPTTSAPPRTANTSELTQAEVDRLAAITVRSAADLDGLFQRAGHSSDVACTRSRTEDWDRIFEQAEMLAKGLSLHAGTGDHDYRQMNTSAPTLLHLPPTGGNPRGTPGSIYAMGRRISGSGAYGRGTCRERVLALLHGILAL